MVHVRAVVVVLVFVAGVPTSADSYLLGRLPTKNTKLGLTLDVVAESVGGNGYRPIELVFSPAGKTFGRDRHVEFRLTTHQGYRANFEYTFRRSLTLPAQAGTVTKTVYVPSYCNTDDFVLELREDGRLVPEGRVPHATGINSRPHFAAQMVTVGILVPRDLSQQKQPWHSLPDIRTLITVLGDGPIPAVPDQRTPNESVPDRLTSTEARSLILQTDRAGFTAFRLMDEISLPRSWLGYTQLDVIIAPAPVVDRIASEQPERFDQLQHWLSAGGNLWLYADTKNEAGFVRQLNYRPLLNHQVLSPTAMTRLLRLTQDNDEYAATNGRTMRGYGGIRGLNNFHSSAPRQAVYDALVDANHPFATTMSQQELASRIDYCDFGLGQVVMIHDEGPFPGSFQLWKSIEQFQGTQRLRWTERNGVNVPMANPSYWNWLIGGLGQPPVRSFVALNLLFAAIIGPVCYSYLRRHQRLHLLYFVAPMFAFTVTVGLFVFAIASDGLSTKQRIRQLTWLASGEPYHTTESRSTYYRVLGFHQRIEVSADTAVYPVRYRPAGYDYSYRGNEGRQYGVVTSTDDRQRLTAGFLPARRQVHYKFIHPWKLADPITIDLANSRATHQLPVTIHQLLVCDQDGFCWQASDMSPQETVAMKRCADPKIALAKMLPSDIIPRRSPTIDVVPWGYGKFNTQFDDQNSLLEQRLRSWLKKIPAGSFVATAELEPSQLGIAGTTIVQGTHVIMGELP